MRNVPDRITTQIGVVSVVPLNDPPYLATTVFAGRKVMLTMVGSGVPATVYGGRLALIYAAASAAVKCALALLANDARG